MNGLIIITNEVDFALLRGKALNIGNGHHTIPAKRRLGRHVASCRLYACGSGCISFPFVHRRRGDLSADYCDGMPVFGILVAGRGPIRVLVACALGMASLPSPEPV